MKFLFYRSLNVINNIHKEEEDKSYNERSSESLKRLPIELQYEILWLLSDYQLRKLELEFRDIIHSKYFLKKRVKYIFKIAAEEEKNEREEFFTESNFWFVGGGLAIPTVAFQFAETRVHIDLKG